MTPLIHEQKIRRSERIAQEPIEPGRRTDLEGSARHVKKKAKEKKGKAITGTSPPRSRLEIAQATVQKREAALRAQIYGLLDKVADGQRRTDAEFLRLGHGDMEHFLQRVKFIDWLTIDRTHEGTVFTIDQELRDICQGRAPRPALHGFSVRGFLKNLREEITRRREENSDEFQRARWTPDGINTRKQSDLLDWVEAQLDSIP